MPLTSYLWGSCLIYWDDVIIISEDIQPHIIEAIKISSVLGATRVSLKLRKCRFFEQNVEYLRHTVKPVELLTDPKETVTLAEAKLP